MTLDQAAQAIAPAPNPLPGGFGGDLLGGCGAGIDALLASSPLLAQPAQDPTGPLGALLVPLMAVMLFYYMLILRPQQTKQRQYQEMLDNLKENDQVVTNGGIYGVVTGINRKAQQVTLRVDDASGARIRVGMWAVSHLASDEKETSPSGSDSKTQKK